MRLTRFQSVYTLSIDTLYKPPLSQPLSFPTVFANFQAAFLQHMSILRNTIVYGDIKILHVQTLRFLEKLHPVSAMLFAQQAKNRAMNHFHFCTAAQLNIDIPISGLILIFIKCRMCQVFAQQVTYRRKLVSSVIYKQY